MISVASRQETRERAAKPLFFLTLHNSSLRASSPIWASEASLARTRSRAASPPARAFSRDLFHSPKQESLLAGYHNSVSFRVRLSHDFSRTHASCRRCAMMWLEFVVCSLPCSESFFSRFIIGFPPLLKFQFDLEHTDTFKPWVNKLQFIEFFAMATANSKRKIGLDVQKTSTTTTNTWCVKLYCTFLSHCCTTAT